MRHEIQKILTDGGGESFARFAVAALLALNLAACSVTLPGTRNATVEVARIMADAQIRTVEAITRALSHADGGACSVGGAK